MELRQSAECKVLTAVVPRVAPLLVRTAVRWRDARYEVPMAALLHVALRLDRTVESRQPAGSEVPMVVRQRSWCRSRTGRWSRGGSRCGRGPERRGCCWFRTRDPLESLHQCHCRSQQL